jgi:hypothetical protein
MGTHVSVGAHKFFQKSRRHFNIKKLHTEDIKILSVKVENLVAQAAWRPGFEQFCASLSTKYLCVCGDSVDH